MTSRRICAHLVQKLGSVSTPCAYEDLFNGFVHPMANVGKDFFCRSLLFCSSLVASLKMFWLLSLMYSCIQLPARTSGSAIINDAIVDDNPGALALLQFILQIRVNRNSRRSVSDVRTALQSNSSRKSRWLSSLQESVFSFYRLSLIQWFQAPINLEFISFNILWT